jgi:hypothetical protein
LELVENSFKAVASTKPTIEGLGGRTIQRSTAAIVAYTIMILD